MHRAALIRGALAAFAVALAAGCDGAGDGPRVNTDPTPTGPEGTPLPSQDSAPGGGGGGPSAGDPIGSGEP